MGTASDRIGPRLAIMIGLILVTLSLAWLLVAQEAWMLYLFAVVFGFAHAGMGSSQSPLAARLFGLRSHGVILGFIDVSFDVGAAIGPFLTGYIFDITGSYQSAFLVCVAISIVGLVLTALLKPIKGEHSQNEIPSTI